MPATIGSQQNAWRAFQMLRLQCCGVEQSNHCPNAFVYLDGICTRSIRAAHAALPSYNQGISFVRAIAIIAVMSVVSGCATAPKKVTPEQNAASTRFYPGKTSAELKVAATKALTMLAPTKMKVEAQENEVRARYNYSYMARRIGYVGSTTSFFNERAEAATLYNVALTEEAGGTRARFTYLNAEPAGIFQPGFKSNLPVRAEDTVEGFKLFHDRIEYLVGIRSDWVPCPSAPVAERAFVEICDRAGMQNTAP